MMHSKYVLLAIVLVALVGVLTAFAGTTGGLDSPGPPDDTYSYTLEDIYHRLDSGAAGAQSAFTEPSSGPTVGTGHTLDEIMAQAPAVDDVNGATATDVLTGKTFWGLTSAQWGLITGTYPLAPVPRTGQTYSRGIGDDGDLERGVAWPNPRFTANGDGTVTDNLTGLIWLQDAYCGRSKYWSDALAFANSLYDGWTGDGNGGDCGLADGSSAGDWRLPNVRELQSLVHYGLWDPVVPSTHGGVWTEGIIFSGVRPAPYWSSTTYHHASEDAWVVDMWSGSVGPVDKPQNYCVWPVRGGQ